MFVYQVVVSCVCSESTALMRFHAFVFVDVQLFSRIQTDRSVETDLCDCVEPRESRLSTG